MKRPRPSQPGRPVPSLPALVGLLAVGLAALGLAALGLVALGLVALPGSAAAEEKDPGPAAIVVHRNSPIESLRLDDLRSIFNGKLQTDRDLFPERRGEDHYRFKLLIAGSAEEAFITGRLGVTTRVFWRRWAAKLLSGDASESPRRLDSARDVLKLVARDPHAIAVVLRAEVHGPVKIVAVRDAPAAPPAARSKP